MDFWEDFFEEWGDKVVSHVNFVDTDNVVAQKIVTVNELYLQFKHRLLAEIETEHGDFIKSR